jgi:hypothetical protein
MLVESTTIRTLLNTSVTNNNSERTNTTMNTNPVPSTTTTPPKSYTTSTNPLPALTIFLLGILMSSHHQASALSTSIHAQWGLLLSAFGLVRVFTYLLMYIVPPTSIYPSRPPTELMATFCLVSGGVIFMASTEDVVTALEGRGLMPMFVLTLGTALTVFVMAWVLGVLAVKGWAERGGHGGKR